jgi:hypothetical protein
MPTTPQQRRFYIHNVFMYLIKEEGTGALLASSSYIYFSLFATRGRRWSVYFIVTRLADSGEDLDGTCVVLAGYREWAGVLLGIVCWREEEEGMLGSGIVSSVTNEDNQARRARRFEAD